MSNHSVATYNNNNNYYYYFFLNPRKSEGKKKNLEIENAGMTTAPGGRPTQSRHVTKQN